MPYYTGGCEDAYVDKKLTKDEPIVLQDIEYLSQVSLHSVAYIYLFEVVCPLGPLVHIFTQPLRDKFSLKKKAKIPDAVGPKGLKR